MVIDVNKLKEAGVTVRVFERTGKGNMARPSTSETPSSRCSSSTASALPDLVTEAIRELVPTEYGDPVIDGLHNRIHTIQLMEAIERTGK